MLRKLLLFFTVTVVLLAGSVVGYEWWLSKNDPDPAVLMRKRAEKGQWKWASMIHRRSEIPGLLYELNPGFEGMHEGVEVRVNSVGMRDDEPLEGDDPKRVRIVVIGDSTTFGFGVANGETYSDVIERFLNERGRKGLTYEVLNLGTVGYSTLNEAIVLEERALAFDPDLVIVGYNLNDPDVELRQPLQRAFVELEWWQKTHTWQKLAHADYTRRVRELGGGDPLRFAHVEGHANWESVLEGFDRMAAVSKRESLPILLTIWPSGLAKTTWEEYRYSKEHEQVTRAAEAAGLEVLDLWETFAELDKKKILYVIQSHNHPNRKGHTMGGNTITRHILAEHDRYFPQHAKAPR